ncbi:hypothetical protein BJL95_20905 [Methylomonas sp. LWB]|uniref:class I SAM-dependent methyltransferase n=1 Tax=Methylomonas sp. LWB TaxID=1905845 RepID=UPI000923A51A|nr:class I SAM-dependent methyltransferase [Methylomonas sp. LWB]OHX37135.1 hypothetical protein BJL95_20905 [Methylomonas sp. LWB]
MKRITSSVKELFLKLTNFQLSLAFRIQSHLTTQEKIYLSNLAKNKSIILEIGSYLGASACCFGNALKKSNCGVIYCVDTWNNNAMTEGLRDTFSEFTKNIAPYANLIIPMRGFSTEMVEEVATQTNHLDVLFIDGDHSYEGVKADWEAYKHFLMPGSIVIFHDWGWAEGVQRVIEENVKPVVGNFGCLPNMWWGTIKYALC